MQDQTRRHSNEMLDFHEDLQLGKESSGMRFKDMKSTLPELLKSIREGTKSLMESRAEDARLSRELCATFSAYTSWLDVTLEIPSEALPKSYNATKIFLNPKGDLIVVDEQGTINSQPLEEYPTDVVLTVIWLALPKLQSKIDGHLHMLDERLEFLGRMNEELRNLSLFAEKVKEGAPSPEKPQDREL
jgi:hypothetical protein